jgi:hypothetical protein
MMSRSARRGLRALVLLAAVAALPAAACGIRRETVRETVEERAQAARTSAGGTAGAVVQGQLEALQTAGLATVVGGAVIRAEEALDAASAAGDWVKTTGEAVRDLITAQAELVEDPQLLRDEAWVAELTNTAAALRRAGEDAVALSVSLHAEGRLPGAARGLEAIAADLTVAADSLDAALEHGDAAAVGAATPGLTKLLEQIADVRARLAEG